MTPVSDDYLSAAELAWAPEPYLARQQVFRRQAVVDLDVVGTTLDLRDAEDPAIGLLVSLPQDFEIYKPLVNRILSSSFGFSLVLFVREAIANRYGSKSLLNYTIGNEFVTLSENPSRALRTIRAVPRLLGLISSSESSISTHAYAHEIFLGLPQSVVKLTLQHGWECLGFLQHYEQLESFRGSVRSAADIACCWGVDPREGLSFAHWSQGTVATGVCKMTFESGRWPERPVVTDSLGAPRVLVADNRRSPRFSGTTEMRHWEVLVRELMSDSRLNCTVRNHQRDASLELENFTTSSLRGCAYLVSPPSTILIDAISEGCLPIAFSTGAIPRNLENFGPIRYVSSYGELCDLIVKLDHVAYYGEICRWLFANIFTIRGADRLLTLLSDLKTNLLDQG